MDASKTSNPLEARLIQMIREQGPIDLADYMRIALTDPDHGYYTNAEAVGARGDFVTAPEISQMFGELIGVWIVDTWQRMGAPEDVRLVELGPGHGTLMADALRAVRGVSGMPVDPYLVEVSPVLRARQQALLSATWLDSVDALPPGPAIVIANEFFDALPVSQIQRDEDGWRRRVIDAGPDESGLFATKGPIAEDVPANMEDAPVGAIVELAPERGALAAGLARRICKYGGAALIIDYGPETSAPGDSLQAVRGHEYTDPFAAPGQADLTAHVDFASLGWAAAAEGAQVFGPVPQAAFLAALGLVERADALKRSASPEQRRDIDLAAHRLTAPDQMGTLFKAMAIAAPALTGLAGFGS